MEKAPLRIPIINKVFKGVAPIIKNEKTNSYFAITLSLFTLSFFGLFAIKPTLTTAVSLITSVSELRELDVKYEKKIYSLIKAQTEYERVRNDLYLIDRALPSNPLFAKLALGLERIADKSDISIQQIQIGNTSISDLPPSDKPLPLTFTLSTTGDFFSTINYLNNLISWQRIITLNSLDFSKDSAASNSSNIKLSLKGQTYYEP